MTTLILGATGKTGRRVTALLGADARPASRSSAARFDWADPPTWVSVLDGVTSVYVVPPTWQLDYSAVPEFVALARSVGVRRFVLLSARGGEEGMMHETAVQESGVDWTILRPTWFAQNFSEDFLLPGVLSGEVAAPTGHGAVPFTDTGDIAEVAVAALTTSRHAGRVYALSGRESLSFAHAVAVIAEATGRDIAFVNAPPEAFEAGMIALGMTPDYAAMMSGLFTLVREGRESYPSDGVQQVLGREPRAFSDFVTTTASTGVWR